MPRHDTVFRQITNRLPWDVLDRGVAEHRADRGIRRLSTRDVLLVLLFAHLSGAQSLRETEAFVWQQGGRSPIGLPAVRRSTLADALARRPASVFAGVLGALVGQLTGKLRRDVGQCVRLIDSTTMRLSPLAGSWARFSDTLCGVKAHVVYDPDADCPLYLGITPSRVNDITAAQTMPVERGATYVFDLGYYDYAWWARLDQAACRIVTRLRASTELDVIKTLPTSQDASHILTDRIGFLPVRQAGRRRNPMAHAVREVTIRIDTGRVLRLPANDLDAPASEIADLYKRRWAIELFFRWIKQALRLRHDLGHCENAVRLQITAALIAFVLLKLAHQAQDRIPSLRLFARVATLTVLHRKSLQRLRKAPARRRPRPPPNPNKPMPECA